MVPDWTKIFHFFVKVVVVSLFLGPFLDSADALSEYLDLYESPQALSMGNAMTADAQGYLANYYNPAGLAKFEKNKAEIIAFDWEMSFNGNGLSRIYETKSFAPFKINPRVASSPGSYNYFKFSSVPAYTRRGFSVSLLGSYQYAALSDGVNTDIDTRTDCGLTVGFARNFAGNLIKLGAVGKLLLRNQLSGVYESTSINVDEPALDAMMRSGAAVGFDLGTMITLPYRFLPTLGVVWKDVLNTHFFSSSIMNGKAIGVPDKIPQTVNAAFSVRPNFGRRLRGTVAVEFKHIERVDLPWRKRLHLGFQLEDEKSFYVWLGMNQLYPTGGIGLRVKGGNLELGTSAVDIGVGNASDSDRRTFTRYTVSF